MKLLLLLADNDPSPAFFAVFVSACYERELAVRGSIGSDIFIKIVRTYYLGFFDNEGIFLAVFGFKDHFKTEIG